MSDFSLDSRLQADCIELTQVNDIHVLLMNNSLLPWFILVPKTPHIELHQLPEAQFQHLMALQCTMARFIESHFTVDKINTAAIGNVVSQLHVHVIGRRKDDHCWPGVVWGNPQKTPYTDSEAQHIQQQLTRYLAD
ncbi:MAG: HIT family protein [Deltaproteobacteria bacterium]|nr:HIT family protein [Deltaproteobacteria bacterium]